MIGKGSTNMALRRTASRIATSVSWKELL